MFFLFVLALLLFGPRKLPEISRQIGKILGEFKRASSDFKNQLESEVSQMDVAQQRDYYRTRAEELAREVKQGFSPNGEGTAAPMVAGDSPYPVLPPAPATLEPDKVSGTVVIAAVETIPANTATAVSATPIEATQSEAAPAAIAESMAVITPTPATESAETAKVPNVS